MAGSTIWLGREAERAAEAWFRSLPEWQPFPTDPAQPADTTAGSDRSLCLTCLHLGDHLQLDELPHGALHSLAAPVSTLVDGCFRTVAAERYKNLLNEGWVISNTDAIIQVSPPESAGVVVYTAQIRSDLMSLHAELVDLAVNAVLRRRDAILEAARWNVEPVVRRLADELIREVCGD